MHKLQRVGLFGITMLLLLGFWAGLWYQGQRRSGAVVFAAEGAVEHTQSAESGGSGGGTEAGLGSGAAIAQGNVGGSGAADASSEAEGAKYAWDGDPRGAEGLAADVATAGDGQALAVHVVGQVASPGLYFMPQGSRIYDAIMEAEPEEDADLAKINMAVHVEDGMQIRVPAIGKPSPWGVDGYVVRASESQDNIQSGSVAAVPGKININTASSKELETLPGIGPAFAQRIIQYREQNGGFKSVEDLTKVSGIGPAKMGDLRDKVTCS